MNVLNIYEAPDYRENKFKDMSSKTLTLSNFPKLKTAERKS